MRRGVEYKMCTTADNKGFFLSQPTPPITYFPNPSFFSQPSSSNLPNSPTFQPHFLSSPSRSSMSQRSPIPPASTYQDDDDEQGERTPRRGTVHLASAGSSPKTRTSSTIGRRSLAGIGSGAASRTMSNPGYGATHQTTLAALGLGDPEHRRTMGDALASPRRISTSNPHTEPSSRVPHSQPVTASTPRFRDMNRYTESRSAQYTDNSLLNTSSIMGKGHQRNISASSIIRSTRVYPMSPTSSALRKLRSSASLFGLHVGGQMEYDGDEVPGGVNDGAPEEDPGLDSNGTRVWYRCGYLSMCSLGTLRSLPAHTSRSTGYMML